MKFTKFKKGAIDQLVPVVTALVALGIVLAISFLILAELRQNTKIIADSNASNAVAEVQTAMADIPGWLPIIVIVIIGALILSLVSMFGRQQ